MNSYFSAGDSLAPDESVHDGYFLDRCIELVEYFEERGVNLVDAISPDSNFSAFDEYMANRMGVFERRIYIGWQSGEISDEVDAAH
jgi:hypothetical protein